MQPDHPRPQRPALSSILLAALLGAGSLTLVQCTMVGDRVTGLDVSSQESVGCIQDCNDRYAELFKVEQKRHIAAMSACMSLDPGPEKNDCLTAESNLHVTNKAGLTKGKNDCSDSCHRQGGGTGG